MQLTQVQDSNTLLTYSLSTSPAPVQVSEVTQANPPETVPSYADLTFVVSNSGACGSPPCEVFVSKIVIQLPVGDPQLPDSMDLTETPTGMRPSISPSADWNAPSSPAPGTFVFTPVSGQPLLVEAQGYSINIANIQVSTMVGTASVTIKEHAALSQTDPQSERQCTLAVSKFPYGFYAGNFTAQKPLVQNGQGAVLSWVGSDNAVYTILWNTQSQDVSRVRQWTSPPLTDTTAFILQVQAQEQGQTVSLYFSTTVVVADPNLTATQLTVLQTSTLRGPLNALRSTTVGAPNSGAAFTVYGDGTMNGPWRVYGMTTLGSASMGAANASSLTCTGQLDVYGRLNATGSCTLGFTSDTSRAVNNIRGATLFDGFVQVSSSNDMPALMVKSTVSNKSYCKGIYAQVASSKYWGIGSNGLISTSAGQALFTHLPTSDGHRVVTSPLTLEAELQFSGQARLAGGKCHVHFEQHLREMHSHAVAYKVFITPTGQCQGLCVVNKSHDGFVVEELGGGRSDASFDWLVVARKAKSLEDNTAEEMPEALPGINPPPEASE